MTSYNPNISRREFIRNAAILAALYPTNAYSADLNLSERIENFFDSVTGIFFSNDIPLEKKVTKSGILLDYELVPSNRKDRKSKRFKVTSVSGSKPFFFVEASDKKWRKHHKILSEIIKPPVSKLEYSDTDGIFGMISYRIHPQTLQKRHFHTGIDLFKEKGSVVKAIYDGTVLIKNSDDVNGNWLKIKHPIITKDGFHIESLYLHLDKIAENIEIGSSIKSNEIIGAVGSTGSLNGYMPHLHHELVMKHDKKRPIVLDPSMVYFNYSSYSEIEKKFRNLTRNVVGDSKQEIAEKLSTGLNALPSTEKRHLLQYVSYWEEKSKIDIPLIPVMQNKKTENIYALLTQKINH